MLLKMLLIEILLGENRILNSCPKSPQLCVHVTFHVQGYKQVHKRISFHMTVIPVEGNIFGL
jgi:hypothetical protein